MKTARVRCFAFGFELSGAIFEINNQWFFITRTGQICEPILNRIRFFSIPVFICSHSRAQIQNTIEKFGFNAPPFEQKLSQTLKTNLIFIFSVVFVADSVRIGRMEANRFV
jgi:hypothetical protein